MVNVKAFAAGFRLFAFAGMASDGVGGAFLEGLLRCLEAAGFVGTDAFFVAVLFVG